MSSMVMIRCPVTDETVASGLLMARDAFRVLRTKNTDIRCPACGELHLWQDVTAWLARVRYPEGGKSAKQVRRSNGRHLVRSARSPGT
jgi:hypothetical protein